LCSAIGRYFPMTVSITSRRRYRLVRKTMWSSWKNSNAASHRDEADSTPSFARRDTSASRDVSAWAAWRHYMTEGALCVNTGVCRQCSISQYMCLSRPDTAQKTRQNELPSIRSQAQCSPDPTEYDLRQIQFGDAQDDTSS